MPDQSVRNPAIVLVEDEPDILIILHRLMRDLTGGYDIVTVNGGAEHLPRSHSGRCPWSSPTITCQA